MTKLITFVGMVAAVLTILGTQVEAQSKNLIDVYTDSVFNYAVLNNRKPVVVWFGNSKCFHCRWMYPQLERVAKNRSEKIYLAKVDTEKLPDLAADYGVTVEPTVMTLNNGEIIDVVEGPQWAKILELTNNAAKMQN